MSTGKKVIVGIVIAILVVYVFYGLSITDEDRARWAEEEESEKIRLAEEQAEKEKQQRIEERNNELKIQRDKESSIEYRMENMVLNYKGKDGIGFSIKDFSDARCGDNQSSFAQYLGTPFDGKMDYHEVMIHSPVNIDWNPPCLGTGWHFGVNEKGNVIAWDYSTERQDILDYLDTQG